MPKSKPKKTCFVVGPIGDSGTPVRGHADWLLDEIIAPVFEEHFKDFDVVRSDKITQPGMIDSQVINHLLDSELVIADMSLQNANAFYEMGLRHMERKPIIHMFRAGENIPFDVKPYRAIPFAFEHPKQRFEARELLKQAIEAVLAEGYQVENPVTRARGFAEISRHAMPGIDVVLAEIESLKSRVRVAEAMASATNARTFVVANSPHESLFATGVAPITSASLVNPNAIGIYPNATQPIFAATNSSIFPASAFTTASATPSVTLPSASKPKK